MSNFHAFPVWDTVVVGNGARTEDDFNRLYREGRSWERSMVDDGARVLTHPSFAVAEVETELDLVLIRAQDLGFTHMVRGGMMDRRAIEMGLQLCPVEVPFQATAQIRTWRNVLRSSISTRSDPHPCAWFRTESFVLSERESRWGAGSIWYEPLFNVSDEEPRGAVVNTFAYPCYSGVHGGDGYWDPDSIIVYIRSRS